MSLNDRIQAVLSQRKARKNEYLKAYRETHRETLRAYERNYHHRRNLEELHGR